MWSSLRTAASSLLLVVLSTGLVPTVQAQACCQDACVNEVANVLGTIECPLFLNRIIGLPVGIIGFCPEASAAVSSACTCLTASSSYCSRIAAASAASASARLGTSSAARTTSPAEAAAASSRTTAPASPASAASAASASGGPAYVFTATTPGYCSVDVVLYLTQITTYLPAGLPTAVVPAPSSSAPAGLGCEPLTSTVLVFESSVTLGPGDTATVRG